MKRSYVKWTENVARSTFPEINPTTVNRSLTDFVFTNGSFLQQPLDKKAVVDGDNFRTFGDIRKDVGSIRKFAEDLSLKKGDRIALISPNHIDYFSLVQGFVSAGLVVSPINPTYTYHEVEHQLKVSQSKSIITHVNCLDVVEKAAKDSGVKQIIVLEDKDIPTPSKVSSFISVSKEIEKGRSQKILDNPGLPIVASGNDLAVLPFSSGTTGLPKGTMLSHANLCVNLEQFHPCETRFFRPEDVIMSPLPFFHIYGFTVSMMSTLMHGKTLITSKRFDLEKFCQAVETYKVSRAHLVPPIVLLLAKSPIVSKHDLSSLRVIISAAAPLGAELEKEAMNRFPGLLCKQAWGMSELSPIGTCICDDDPRSGSGSVGPPIASTEAKVVDINTRKALEPNQEGELLIRGPQVMLGYLNEPKKTKECLDSEGWLSTGDIAKIDEDGFIYITDRLKELIKYKGFQVAPAELEALLLTHPKILDAVVIPRPDECDGEMPRAYVVLRPNMTATAEEIIDWAAPQVAHYKRLKGGVHFIEKIPKTTSGKILRREVVAMDRAQYPPIK